jgi:hypothetical protein
VTTAPTERLRFHALTFVPEGDEVLIGCPARDSYAVFPATGVALLGRLRDGMSPSAAAAWFAGEYGEPVDIDDFIATLRDVEFIRDHEGVEKTEEAPAVSARLQRVARVLLSRAALTGYALSSIAALLVLVADPEVRPRPDRVFFTGSLLAIQLAFLVGGPVGIAWHELFHVLSGAKLGLPCRLAVSRRMYFLVFESRLNGLLTLPRRRRYPTFLAGMLADVVAVAVLTLVAAWIGPTGDGWVATTARLALALAYLTLLRLIWQFFLCLRTDLYYLAGTALGCHDLHGATMALLRNTALRLVGRAGSHIDMNQWGDRDRAVARWYAPAAAAGFGLLITVGVAALLPVGLEFLRRSYDGLRVGALGMPFWDSALSLLLSLFPMVAAAVIAVRERRR